MIDDDDGKKAEAEAEYLRYRAKQRASFFGGWKWSDNQRTWWRFLWARHYSIALGLTIECHGGDGWYPPFLRIVFLRLVVLVALPRFLLMRWMARRKYGVEYDFSQAYIQVFYGKMTHDSSTDQRKGYFPPWQTRRFHMHRYFALDGVTVLKEFHDGRPWDEEYAYRESGALPKRSYKFRDYDGEEIIATVYVEERHWKYGTSWCRWLSWFIPDVRRRNIDIEFSKETGREKGSYKGGTVGSGAELKPGESVDLAMQRYCVAHKMTSLEPLPYVWVRPQPPKQPPNPDLEPAKAASGS